MYDKTNMFEVAIRAKLRFDSPKNKLSLEQLWDVPLRSKDEFNLDTIAKSANNSLKKISEESFVSTSKTPAQEKLELALDIIKHVIETKLVEEEEAKIQRANKQEKAKLLEILGEKQDGKLSELSENELKKRIAALDDA